MNNREIGLLLDIFEEKCRKGKKDDRVIAQYAVEILQTQSNKLNYELTDYHFIRLNWMNWFVGVVSREERHQRFNKVELGNIDDEDYFQAEMLRKAWISIEVERFFLGNTNRANSKENKMIDGWQYEELCISYFEDAGYENIEHTGKSGDQGIDIIAYKNGEKYGIQCKYYSKPVTNKAVQEAFAGATYYGCDKSIVITNNIFTQSAQELALANRVILIGGMTPDNITSKRTEEIEEFDDSFYKMISVDQYDGLLKQSMHLIMRFGKACTRLLENGLHISESRSEMILSQLSSLGIISKSIYDVFYTLTVKKVYFDDNTMYVYRLENDIYKDLDDSTYDKYGITAVEVLYIKQHPFDTRLYTNELEGEDDSVLIYADYFLVYQNHVYYKNRERNLLRFVKIPLIGITSIRYNDSSMIVSYDRRNWFDKVEDDDIVIQDNGNDIIIRFGANEKDKFKSLGKIMAARIGLIKEK